MYTTPHSVHHTLTTTTTTLQTTPPLLALFPSLSLFSLFLTSGSVAFQPRRGLSSLRQKDLSVDHPNVLPLFGVSMELFAPSYCMISPWMSHGNIMDYLARHPEHDRVAAVCVSLFERSHLNRVRSRILPKVYVTFMSTILPLSMQTYEGYAIHLKTCSQFNFHRLTFLFGTTSDAAWLILDWRVL